MDYMEFSLPQLKELAKSLKIPHFSTMRKPELLAAIEEILGPSVKKPAAVENLKPVGNSAEGAQTVQKASAAQTIQVGRKPQVEQASQPVQKPQVVQTSQPVQKPQAVQASPSYQAPQASQSSQTVQNVQTAPRPVRVVSDRVRALIGDRAEEFARDALEINGKIGMTVERLYELASGDMANGILEVMPEGYGFIRCDNFLPGELDVYVNYQLIKRCNLKTGDVIQGGTRIKTPEDKSKYAPLLFISSVNGVSVEETRRRPDFEKLTPIYPNERISLTLPGGPLSMRIMDLLSPIGKGQRGMIVAPPKAGKTTLLKQIAKAVSASNPEMTLIVLLIDERPEEVTDIKEAIEIPGTNAQVIYSTFDEMPEHHKRVAEMVLGRAKRLVEHGKDVMILLDSITRLARAYNLTVTPSGRTLSGGLDPAALYAPKRFFGAARNMRQGGSLTILATALVETGSRMDDVVFEEFKGTGNMELVLNRKLSEKRVFPAIDIAKSSTRNENLLLTPQEQEAIEYIRKNVSSMKGEEAAEHVVDLFAHTKNNEEFINTVKKTRLI
jgi:transcription termination factor Rho